MKPLKIDDTGVTDDGTVFVQLKNGGMTWPPLTLRHIYAAKNWTAITQQF